jgi:DNA-binding transcriptional ArsR family regulator
MANPTRLRIVELLCAQEMSVNQICDALSLRQSATSQNLATLTRAGILKVEQQGAHRIYRARGPRIARILALIEEFCQVHELYGYAEDLETTEEAEENLMG